MTSSTAAARSSLILRMFSSALGDRLLKFSQASNRIAEGDVDPGRKTDTLDAETAISKESDLVGRFYYLGLSALSHTLRQR
jgi:hypothetical protein